MLNAKVAIIARGDVALANLLNVVRHSLRDSGQERADVLFFPFRHQFHLSGGQVANVTRYLETSGESLSGKAKPHPLNPACIVHTLADAHGFRIRNAYTKGKARWFALGEPRGVSPRVRTRVTTPPDNAAWSPSAACPATSGSSSARAP